MPKKPRAELPPGFVHVTARGNRRADIFTAERNVHCFEAILDDAVRKSGIVCHAVCLMPNHFHLVLEVEEIAELSLAMQRLNGVFAQWFNRRYGLDGHVFQNRYAATPIESDSHALEAVRYVLLNPVRAGICARPSAWTWSSYLATAGLAKPPAYLTTAWVLGLMHRDERIARERFKSFIADGIVSQRALPGDLVRGRSRDTARQAPPRPLPSAA